MILRRRYKVNTNPGYTYKELEYIENPNRLGIVPNSKAINNLYGFEAKFKCNQSDLDLVENNGSQIKICGFYGRDAGAVQQTYLQFYLRKNNNIDYFTIQYNAGIYTYPAGHAKEGQQTTDSSPSYSCGPSDDSVHVIKMINNLSSNYYQAYLDGTLKTNFNRNVLNQNPVTAGVDYFIFGSASAESLANSNTRLYYFKAYDDQETTIMDIVPVKRVSDNKIGLYDTLNDDFYYGSFTAGPEVGPLILT